jgi:hypothetical protein
MLVCWALVAACGVMIQGQFYPYHWHPIVPPLALLGGIGLDALWKWMGEVVASRGRVEPAASAVHRGTAIATVIGVALSTIVLIGATTEPFLHLYRYARAAARSDMSGYDRIEFGPFGHHGGVFPELVDYVRARTSREDPVLVWGSAAGVNYLSDRRAIGPFGFVQPLVDPPDTELRRRYRELFISRLTSTPPRYVVALNATACARSPSPSERQLLGRTEGLIRCLADLPALDELVKQRYVMERTVGPLEVWRAR